MILVLVEMVETLLEVSEEKMEITVQTKCYYVKFCNPQDKDTSLW
jgi:hypothetical protein